MGTLQVPVSTPDSGLPWIGHSFLSSHLAGAHTPLNFSVIANEIYICMPWHCIHVSIHVSLYMYTMACLLTCIQHVYTVCVYCMCIQHVHNDMYTCPGGVVSVIRLGKIEPFGWYCFWRWAHFFPKKSPKFYPNKIGIATASGTEDPRFESRQVFRAW